MIMIIFIVITDDS